MPIHKPRAYTNDARTPRACCAFLAYLLMMGLVGCKPATDGETRPCSPLPRLTVGIQVSPAMTLVMIAADKGFFEEAGVDVVIKEFTAGKFALQAFLGGSLDAAVSGEVPVALSMLQGNRFRVITQVVERTINECRVVVRKEKGLDTAEAYFGTKRRKLATSFGGGPEFFTYNFLKKHGIASDQVEIISQKPEDMPAALVSGTVDAIAIFDPQARIAERMMGDLGTTFSDADIYSELYVVAVTDQTLRNRPEDVLAFLRGLHSAQFYIQNHPEESKDILSRYTQLERDLVDDFWDNFVFRLSINDRFLKYTTAEAEWAVTKGIYPPETPIPDFRSVLYCDLLRQIDPDAVTLMPPSSKPARSGD